MAAEIIEEITYASSGQIVREDGTVLDDLEEYRDLRIGKRIFDADAEFAAAEIEQRGVKFLTIGGPEGNFYLGPRSLRELRGTGRYQDALLDAMRDVQYMDRSQFHNAKIFSVAYEDGTKMTMSVWNSGPSFLFQGVDELSLLIDGRASKPEFLNIPYASLPHLVGDSFSWIDEQQSIVRAFTESEWPALLARARQYALRQSKQSPDAPPNKKKGWWPFK
jgi:hypothetical protein